MGALQMKLDMTPARHANSLAHHFLDEGFCHPEFGQPLVRKPMGQCDASFGSPIISFHTNGQC